MMRTLDNPYNVTELSSEKMSPATPRYCDQPEENDTLVSI